MSRKVEKMVQLKIEFEPQPRALMTPDEIYERASDELLTLLAEDRRIERKVASFGGSSLGVYFSMWANSAPDGGLIVIGQRDAKNGGGFEGCNLLSPEGLAKTEKTAHTYCPDAKFLSKRVEVRNLHGERDFVILFRVYYHKSMVVKTSGREAWTRRSDSKHLMTDAEVTEMGVSKGQIPFETEDCRLVYPQDFSVDLVQKWSAKVRTMMDSGHHLTDVEVMVYRKLGRMQAGDFVPNNACALIFAKDPKQLFPGCWIRIMRYNGDFEGVGDAYNVEKDIWIENGPIPQLIEDAEAAIKAQIRTFSPLGKDGRFEDAEEYPFEAWHEAIVNACVHRSYGDGLRNAPIFVRLFESRMEIESPGPFMPFVNAQNVYERHDPRHPHLMQALFFSSLVRMNREGTKRMRELMTKRGLPPPDFEQKEIGHSVVRVTLKNDIAHRRVWLDRDVSKLVSDTIANAMTTDQKRIVNWLAASEDGQLTINGAVKSLKIAWQTAQKTMHELCRIGVIQHIRFKPLKKNVRDPRAYFRLRSDAPIPEGAHIAEMPRPKKARRKST